MVRSDEKEETSGAGYLPGGTDRGDRDCRGDKKPYNCSDEESWRSL